MAQAMPDLAITAPDLPGHGESADWDGSGDYHDLSTAVAAAVLSDLAQNGPVDLFGHSLGATIALRLALATPEQIRSLTLFEPVLFCAAADTAQFAAFLDSQEAYGAAARAQDWPLAARLFNRLWGTGDPWDTIPLARRDYLTRRMPLVSSCDAVLFHDSASILAPARLEALSMPVLLAQGAASPAIISAVMDTLGRRLPHAHRHVETGAGHMLPITHASSLAPVLARHLATRP
jgi:pimeloyl-ACP methyl ester carboxylesterase